MEKLFYERFDMKKEVRIVWKTWPTYFSYAVILLGTLFMILTGVFPAHGRAFALITLFFFVLLMVYSVVYMVKTYQVSKEMKDAMRINNIRVEGNRLSFRNPFICTIPKNAEGQKKEENKE